MDIQEFVKGRHTPPVIKRSEILNISSGAGLSDDMDNIATMDMLFSLKLGYPGAKHEIDVVLNYQANYAEDLDAIKQADFKVVGCHGEDFIEGISQLDWLVLCHLHTQAAAKISGLVPEWHYSQGQADFVGMDYFTFGDEVTLQSLQKSLIRHYVPKRLKDSPWGVVWFFEVCLLASNGMTGALKA